MQLAVPEEALCRIKLVEMEQYIVFSALKFGVK